MAFEPVSWFASFVLNRTGNTALDALDGHGLDDAMDRALNDWADGLPNDLCMHSPAALFPRHDGAHTPPPPVATLRERLDSLQLPSPDEWIAAIRGQWACVGSRLGDDAHPFFRTDIAVVGPHLDGLAARLDRVCKQDDALFKHRALQLLEAHGEQLQRVDARLDEMMDAVAELIGDVVQKRVDQAMTRADRRELKRHIEKTIDRALESQRRRLDSASVASSGQWLIFERCFAAFSPLDDDPAQAFRPGMDGPALFESFDATVQLPPSVRATGLEKFYRQIAPALAGLLIQAGQTVLSASLARLDETVDRLQNLAERLEGVADLLSADDGAAAVDPLLTRVRQGLLNKVLLQMDIAGLRADRELQGSFDDFFVCPALTRETKRGDTETLDTPESILGLCLADERRTVVEGSPGSGKSTWTRWLQRRAMLDAADRIAIRLPLRSVGEALPSVQQFVRDAAGAHLAEEVSAPTIRRWLDEGAVVLVLDGFDEVPPGERDAAFDWLVGLSGAAAAASLILTSRALTTDHLSRLPQPWSAWTLAPFDEPRIEAYVKQWFRCAPIRPDDAQAIDAEALARAWRSDPNLRALTENPLLLTTLLVVHRLDGRLPNGRSKLYQRYVDGMLGQWDSRRGVRAPDIGLDETGRRRVLRRLAVHLFVTEAEELERKATVDFLAEHLPSSCDADAVLDAIEERSGLFLGPGAYHFAHKSLAEFLVAEAAIEGDVSTPDGDVLDRARLLRERHNDRWRNVLYFWSGAAPVGLLMGLLTDCLQRGAVRDVVLALSIADDQSHRLSATQIDQLLLMGARSGSPMLTGAGSTALLPRTPRWLDAEVEIERIPVTCLGHDFFDRSGAGSVLARLLIRAGLTFDDLVRATAVDSQFARELLVAGRRDAGNLNSLFHSPLLTPVEYWRRLLVHISASNADCASFHGTLREEEPELAALGAATWLDAITSEPLQQPLYREVLVHGLEAGRAWVGLDVPLHLLPPAVEDESGGPRSLESDPEAMDADSGGMAAVIVSEGEPASDYLADAIELLAWVAGGDGGFSPEHQHLATELRTWLERLRDKRDAASPACPP